MIKQLIENAQENRIYLDSSLYKNLVRLRGYPKKKLEMRKNILGIV